MFAPREEIMSDEGAAVFDVTELTGIWLTQIVKFAKRIRRLMAAEVVVKGEGGFAHGNDRMAATARQSVVCPA
jgi:hypothetical protein